MPKFIIETVATASIREFWTVEADNETDARNMLDDGDAELLFDEVVGDEEDRSVVTISPADHFAQMVQEHHARQAAPAMLAALQELAENRHPDYLHADDRAMIIAAITAATGEA